MKYLVIILLPIIEYLYKNKEIIFIKIFNNDVLLM